MVEIKLLRHLLQVILTQSIKNQFCRGNHFCRVVIVQINEIVSVIQTQILNFRFEIMIQEILTRQIRSVYIMLDSIRFN